MVAEGGGGGWCVPDRGRNTAGRPAATSRWPWWRRGTRRTEVGGGAVGGELVTWCVEEGAKRPNGGDTTSFGRSVDDASMLRPLSAMGLSGGLAPFAVTRVRPHPSHIAVTLGETPYVKKAPTGSPLRSQRVRAGTAPPACPGKASRSCPWPRSARPGRCRGGRQN